MLLRYSQHQIFVFIIDLLQVGLKDTFLFLIKSYPLLCSSEKSFQMLCSILYLSHSKQMLDEKNILLFCRQGINESHNSSNILVLLLLLLNY